MNRVKTYPQALSQPLMVWKTTHAKKPPLDKAALWRSAADKVELSDLARLRLEWMIFYDTVGNQKAYATARQFVPAPRISTSGWPGSRNRACAAWKKPREHPSTPGSGR